MEPTKLELTKGLDVSASTRGCCSLSSLSEQGLLEEDERSKPIDHATLVGGLFL